MKFLRFGEIGQEKPGVLDANGNLRSLEGVIDDLSGDVLGALPDVTPEDLPLVEGAPRIGAPVGRVGKFLCIGLNYSDHAAEVGLPIPDEPIVFMKATSAIAGPNDPIIIPRKARKVDYEAELGVVIGKTAKYVSQENALDHVAGYCAVNDISEREWQLERGGQWIKGKSCDGFGPVGPWLVTPDEIDDPQNVGLRLAVNGETRQNGSTQTMIFSVAQVIAYLSQMMSLHPGDIIATGTPPGVGMGFNPTRYLNAGDLVDLEVVGLGRQRQRVMRDA